MVFPDFTVNADEGVGGFVFRSTRQVQFVVFFPLPVDRFGPSSVLFQFSSSKWHVQEIAFRFSSSNRQVLNQVVAFCAGSKDA